MRQQVDKITEWLLVGILGFMVLNVVWQVFSRYVLGAPSSFTEELTRFLLIWLGLLGAAYVSGQKKHIAIALLPNRISPEQRRKLEKGIAMLIILFALLALVIGGTRLVYITIALEQYSPALNLPLGIVYAVLPLSGLLVIYYKMADLLVNK